MTKEELYKALVEKRKACKICEGLTNPSVVDGGKYDSNQIGPWSLWQGNLDAKLLIVGQDWSDVDYLRKWEGRDESRSNPTDCNLQHLLEILGVKIKNPRETQTELIFMTNLILCLKEGERQSPVKKKQVGLQASVKDEWIKQCSSNFTKQLIDIIKPKVIIVLGEKPSKAILDAYQVRYPKTSLAEMVNKSPYKLTETTVLFPVYHCGAGGINRNRSMKEQENDWRKIKEWLEKNEGVLC
jgi:DNA polymerase